MSAAGVGGRQEGMVIMAKKHVQKGNVQKKKTPAGKVSEKKLHMEIGRASCRERV